MNSKLLLGCFGFCSVMSFFVACGSGSIDPYSVDDQVASISVTLDKDKSISACLADPVCKADYEAAENPPSSAQIPSSSSSIPVVPGLSSGGLVQISSGGVIPPFPISSSSGPIVIVSSQSSGGISGTCAPSPAIAELGQQVTWTFDKAASVPVTDVFAATFEWTFAGASEPTFSGQGAPGLTKVVSYSTSGSHATTLSINGDVPMTCAPVQVNGAPITGCECTVDNPSPDVAADGVATWSVTGCLTTANISGYSWAGTPAAPTTTFAHTFTAKGEVFTPTLSVYNDDNTVQPVTCPAATAIDATKLDYILDGSPTGKYTLEAGTYSMRYACNASVHHQPSINISASGAWESFNVVYSTSSNPSGVSSPTPQHNISFADLFGAWPADNKVPTEMISITTDHAFVVQCQ